MVRYSIRMLMFAILLCCVFLAGRVSVKHQLEMEYEQRVQNEWLLMFDPKDYIPPEQVPMVIAKVKARRLKQREEVRSQKQAMSIKKK